MRIKRNNKLLDKIYSNQIKIDFNKTEIVHRVFQFDAFSFKLDFLGIKEKQDLYLYSDIYGEWSFKKLESPDGFSYNIICETPGVFNYCFAFIEKNICSWLPMQFRTIIVDPISCKNINFYTFLPNLSGDYLDWLKDFVQIKSMGFDYIHLLPITEMDTAESPYACVDFFEVNQKFRNGKSTKDVLDEIVDFCFKHEIHLCIDLVFNHVGVNHKICKETPNWIQLEDKFKDGLKRAGCWHNNDWFVWEDIVLLNYDHPEIDTKNKIFEYMKDYALFWSEVASKTKGMIRYDNLHSSNIKFIKYVTESIKNNFPDLIVLSELFCGTDVKDKYRVDSHSNLLFATPWMNPFASDIRRQIKDIHEKFSSINYLFPISSHDSPSAFQLYGSHEAAVSRFAVHSFFGLGAVGLTQGIEYKAEVKKEVFGVEKRVKKSIDENIASFLLKINTLVKEFKCFLTPGNFEFIDNDHSAILAGVRHGALVNEPDFLLIVNLNSNNAETLNLKEIFVSQFEDENILTGQNIQLSQSLIIPAGSCYIFKSKHH